MLKNWIEFLSSEDVQKIHDTSMKLLKNIGIEFPEENAISIFQEHGFKTEGQTVYMTEEQVMQAIKSVPAQFTIHARNPQRNIKIGGGRPVFAPGYGAPFLVDSETGKRTPTLEDYHNLAKLAHALPNQDMSGHLMVEPHDIPSETAHIQMLHANMLLSDKPFIGIAEGAEGAKHT
ncbi:MAG: trimethylamine--corrinoid methyltransferase, partial [Anaerolineae bacterium]|nr:trimethylamine--corrinoid methyltransferase [Anaerolineae bacterium]